MFGLADSQRPVQFAAGFYFNDGNLNIWKIENNKIVLKFSYLPNTLIWNAEWVDNQTVRFEALAENHSEMNCFGKNGFENISADCITIYELKINAKK